MKEYAQDFSAQGTVEKKIADYGTADYKQAYRNPRSSEVHFCPKETLGEKMPSAWTIPPAQERLCLKGGDAVRSGDYHLNLWLKCCSDAIKPLQKKQTGKNVKQCLCA